MGGGDSLENKLKKAREDKGYTQEDMAKELGYNGKSGYNMVENGKVKISLEMAKKISKILDIPIEEIWYFFTLEVQVNKTNIVNSLNKFKQIKQKLNNMKKEVIMDNKKVPDLDQELDMYVKKLITEVIDLSSEDEKIVFISFLQGLIFSIKSKRAFV